MLIAAMLTVSGMDFHARDAAEVCNIKVVTDDLSYTVMITRLSGVPVRQASPDCCPASIAGEMRPAGKTVPPIS